MEDSPLTSFFTSKVISHPFTTSKGMQYLCLVDWRVHLSNPYNLPKLEAISHPTPLNSNSNFRKVIHVGIFIAIIGRCIIPNLVWKGLTQIVEYQWYVGYVHVSCIDIKGPLLFKHTNFIAMRIEMFHCLDRQFFYGISHCCELFLSKKKNCCKILIFWKKILKRSNFVLALPHFYFFVATCSCL
jgi:hypothetical protein